jgi:hypothetical protein
MIYQKQAYTEENEVVDGDLVDGVGAVTLTVSENLTRFCSFLQFIQRFCVELHGLAHRDDLGVLLFGLGLLRLAQVAERR